jgi:hypothetical protein
LIELAALASGIDKTGETDFKYQIPDSNNYGILNLES